MALNQLEHYREEIARFFLPAVRLRTFHSDEDDIRIGQTKIGGSPDMPDQFSWSTFSDMPLVFLAQINLSEIPESITKMPLPNAGILYFFSMYGRKDEHGAPFTDGEMMSGFSRVLWYSGNVNLLRRQTAPPTTPVFRAATVDFAHILSLPSVGVDTWDRDNVLRHLDWSDEEFERLDTLHYDLVDVLHYPVGHQLLGYVQPVQHPLTPLGWRLLFALESDWDSTGMMWADGGVIFFTIEYSALERLDFSNVKAELQSH